MTTPTPSDVIGGPRLATRLAFLAAGFAVSCWAPLIPFAKRNVGADEAQLGLLLLCLGLGSVTAMPVTGWVSARFGAKPMILLGGIGMGLLLPVLALTQSGWVLGAALLLFGASLGTLDVAMNIHAVEVERRGTQPLMSGFHAMYSVGGFVGAGGVTLLLALGLAPTASAVIGGLLTLAAMAWAAPRLLRAQAGAPMTLALPHSIVVLFAALCGISFLVEGAVLDWGALLILDLDLAAPEKAGLGYVLFSIAMTVTRFSGDWVTARLGARLVLLLGGLVTILGLVVLLTAPWDGVAFAGFALIGLGAANLVPVLFSLAGRQTVMPVGLAVAAVTTTGYAGILLGPAAIGFVAQIVGLSLAFWMLAVLMALVPLTAALATRK